MTRETPEIWRRHEKVVSFFCLTKKLRRISTFVFGFLILSCKRVFVVIDATSFSSSQLFDKKKKTKKEYDVKNRRNGNMPCVRRFDTFYFKLCSDKFLSELAFQQHSFYCNENKSCAERLLFFPSIDVQHFLLYQSLPLPQPDILWQTPKFLFFVHQKVGQRCWIRISLTKMSCFRASHVFTFSFSDSMVW